MSACRVERVWLLICVCGHTHTYPACPGFVLQAAKHQLGASQEVRHGLLQKIRTDTHRGRYLTCISRSNYVEFSEAALPCSSRRFGHWDLLEYTDLWKVVLPACVLRWPREACQLVFTSHNLLKWAPTQLRAFQLIPSASVSHLPLSL